MYKKMISNYRWLISNPIVDGTSYLNAWKHFVVLDGLLNTIDYIEPVNKRKRDFIRDYLNKSRINFIQGLSPYTKKFNSNYWKSKFYNAYKCNEIENFYLANKDKLKKKRF